MNLASVHINACKSRFCANTVSRDGINSKVQQLTDVRIITHYLNVKSWWEPYMLGDFKCPEGFVETWVSLNLTLFPYPQVVFIGKFELQVLFCV